MTQLIVREGCLAVLVSSIESPDLRAHFSDDHAPLIYFYPSGDCDSVHWPSPNIKHLRGALYDDRETGLIPDAKAVLMPDGATFYIDEPYWKVGDHVTWTDPDAGACSRTGVLSAVEHTNDSAIRISMEDGWEAEVCESELKHHYE